jgi:suppressor of fused-like protein
LQGISAYWRESPVPHWHYVTYGFSELYDKASDNPEWSGYGFELTFRLADDGVRDEPPMWPLGLLQNLARYVFRSGNVFEAGHYLNTNGPIALAEDTQLRSVAFARDPELPGIDTPNGHVDFLQVVGMTLDEEAALKRWSGVGMLEVLASALPLLHTDLRRDSVLRDPALAARLAEGAARDGSSTGMLFVEQLGWSRRKRWLRKDAVEVEMGAGQVADLLALLPLRLPFQRPFQLIGKQARVVFRPATAGGTEDVDGGLAILASDAVQRDLAATLRPVVGAYPIRSVDGLVVHVLPTHILDGDGKVVRTIG